MYFLADPCPNPPPTSASPPLNIPDPPSPFKLPPASAPPVPPATNDFATGDSAPLELHRNLPRDRRPLLGMLLLLLILPSLVPFWLLSMMCRNRLVTARQFNMLSGVKPWLRNFLHYRVLVLEKFFLFHWVDA
ncbi:hypothetical protein NL676_030841 [Syzygium grande]|nr:hypothetical protein NL676_030841 [Syzygium grande]